MRTEARLVAQRAGGEVVAAAPVHALHEPEDLGRGVPVEVLPGNLVSKLRCSAERVGLRTGGLNVPSATSQRSLKIAKSASATPVVLDGAVRTVKIEGSLWSLLRLPAAMKASRSYLYGT